MKRLILACLMVMALLAAVDAGAQVNWPLRISSHGAYLEDQSGVPFPVIGDAAWSAIVQLNQADLATYLNDRKAKGFTTLIMNAIEHYFSVNPPYDVYGNAPFTNGMNDWSVRNEAYWTNVDYVLNQAKSMGFLVLFYPAYLGYQCGSQGWCQNMEAQSEANMTGYGQFLGNRYKNQGNIIYVHAADAVAQDYTGVYARVVDIVNGIRSVDTTTLHTAESAPERSAMDDYSAFINVNTTYSGNDPAGKVQNDYTRSGALPDCFIESWYEGEETTTLSDVQSQALIAYLGGALLGHVFGNNPVYGFGYDGPWIPSLQSPGAVSMGNIGSLVKSRAWYLLAPDYANVVVTSNKGPGIRNYKATARTVDGATVMIWNPDSTPVTVNMTKISGSSANVWSWNPVNNTATLTGTYPTTGSQTFTPSAGTVLVLDNAGMGFNPPGVVGTGTFNVTASVPGGNGSVSPQTQTINYGQTASIVITPNAGYSISQYYRQRHGCLHRQSLRDHQRRCRPYRGGDLYGNSRQLHPDDYEDGDGDRNGHDESVRDEFRPGDTGDFDGRAGREFDLCRLVRSVLRQPGDLRRHHEQQPERGRGVQSQILRYQRYRRPGRLHKSFGHGEVVSGGSQTFTITPNTRYRISYLLVDTAG